MSLPDTAHFQSIIYDYYRAHKRTFIWREHHDPYWILVSEVMLQQTQTQRVIEKFEQFMTAFPTIQSLASASLREVLLVWQGLGYNRRAKYLHAVAHKVVTEYNGQIPADSETLVTFPGIGPATAASICAFAYNLPTVFIETNIRSVFIHFFFKGLRNVHDKEILPLVEKTLDTSNPREWYYALMDYGVMLKKQMPNPSRKSAHYSKQSSFDGSERQIRGAVIKALTIHQALQYGQLVEMVAKEPGRVKKNLKDLCKEGLIKRQGNVFLIQ